MPQLTFTRFIAAILIVLFHFGRNTAPFNNPMISPLIGLAPAGVSYFFLLSGFILSSVYYKNTENLNKKQYYLKRIVRIYPVYILALVVLVVFLFLTKQSINSEALFLQIFLLQAWFPQFTRTLNVPSWSLSAELFFYLLFPFLLSNLKKINKKWLLITISLSFWVLSLIIYYYGLNNFDTTNNNLTHDFFSYNPLLHLNAFILGVTSYLIFHDLKKPLSKIWSLVFTFSPLVIIVLLLIGHSHILHYKNNGLLAPLFAISLIGLASNRSYLTKFLSLKPLVLLGEISYSIYILQVPIYAWWDAISNRYLTAYPSLQIPGFIVILLFASWFTYKFIERPIRQALKNKIINS